MKYESPTTYQSNVMTTEVKGFEKSRTPRSKYQMKGLARRNKHVKYESSRTYMYQSKVITKVKVLLTDGQTE
jgi:hypothetical protein